MKDPGPFRGFSRETTAFLSELKMNNSREWFERHRGDYEKYVLNPARSLVITLGSRLRERRPEIIAVPRINRSIFRLNRDTRFSADKTPYKTHLALWFWEGRKPRMENPGFYLHLEPGRLMLGSGIYRFPKALLEPYRRAVHRTRSGEELERIASRIEAREGYTLGGLGYKRVPPGYDPGHARAGLLRHTGLFAGTESDLPDELYGEEFVPLCLTRFRPLEELHRWLLELSSNAPRPD